MRAASRNVTGVPAASVMTIMATDPRQVPDKSGCLMVEPLSAILPGNLILISILTAAHQGRHPVRVANVATKDAWVKPRTQIGLLQEVGVETDDNLGFHKPSPGSIEVTCDYQVGATTMNPAGKSDTYNRHPVQVDLSEVGNECTEEIRKSITDLFHKHRNIFTKDGDDLGFTSTIKQDQD